MNAITDFLYFVGEQISAFFDSIPDFPALYNTIVRCFFPILAIAILVRCFRSLLRGGDLPEVWACLSVGNTRLPITHWENIIGRAKSCDLRINVPSVSRIHAALIRAADGTWSVDDLESKGGVLVNGLPIETRTQLEYGDSIIVGGVETLLLPLNEEERELAESQRKAPEIASATHITLWLLTMFQLLCAVQLVFTSEPEYAFILPLYMLGLSAVMWIYYFIMRSIRRTGLEVETIAFFLCTLNLAVVASSDPSSMFKQFICIIMGLMVFFALGFCLRDLKRAVKLRWFMAAAAVILILINIVFGIVQHGARNWISIAGISVQPSELVKICFVYAGAATLDRLFAKRNLIMFIGLTGFIIAALAYMADFGTAAIFFAAFVVIAYLRSGDLKAVALICAGAVFAVLLILRVKPYIADRFATWGNAWADPFDGGYQQTRAMMAAANGGMLGVGAGGGNLVSVFAADTDLVFGVLCEEWGLIIALLSVFSIAALALFTARSAKNSRSSFYTIAACGAMCILVVQTMLNTLGCMDILPLTGVTFPFVSNGGSSMIASWGLLAFVKASDTRLHSSWALKGSTEDEEVDEL